MPDASARALVVILGAAAFVPITLVSNALAIDENGVATAPLDAICVQCEQPDLTYRCLPHISEEYRDLLSGSRALRVACIRDIAKTMAHQSCKAKRSSDGHCDGEDFALDLNRLAAQHARRIPFLKPNDRKLHHSHPKNPNEGVAEADQALDRADRPPRTVVELAQRTAKSSKKQIQGAGEAVGDTMKKTWRCLTSLFQDC
ncbi:MAG: hypothetical protein ACR2PG_20830 [Hyphomicrobiaceae bacterium]